MNYDVPLLQPLIEENGMMTMRLHRLHFSSSPCPHTLAINCPHSQRVSRVWSCSNEAVLAIVMTLNEPVKQRSEIENDY
jgi:hypothetical protein